MKQSVIADRTSCLAEYWIARDQCLLIGYSGNAAITARRDEIMDNFVGSGHN